MVRKPLEGIELSVNELPERRPKLSTAFWMIRCRESSSTASTC